MEAGSGKGGVFRVRGRLGQDLTALAGSRGRVGAPSPPLPQEWFLTSSCHRPLCLGPMLPGARPRWQNAHPDHGAWGRGLVAKQRSPKTDPQISPETISRRGTPQL